MSPFLFYLLSPLLETKIIPLLHDFPKPFSLLILHYSDPGLRIRQQRLNPGSAFYVLSLLEQIPADPSRVCFQGLLKKNSFTLIMEGELS